LNISRHGDAVLLRIIAITNDIMILHPSSYFTTFQTAKPLPPMYRSKGDREIQFKAHEITIKRENKTYTVVTFTKQLEKEQSGAMVLLALQR